MFNLRSIATVVVAVILGLIAIVLVNNYLGNARTATKAAPAAVGVPVVVASTPLPRGVTVVPLALKIARYPADAVPKDAFTSIAEVASFGSPGRVTYRDISANAPILRSDVSDPGGRLTLATTVQPGFVAVSIKANEVTDVGGFVLPGERVDIMLTRSVGVGGDHQPIWISQIVAQDVRVLGVDQAADQKADKPSVARAVTVEVTPAQAQLITLGNEAGIIALTLRHDGDHQPVQRIATTSADLVSGAPRKGKPRTDGGYVVKITRGSGDKKDTVNYSVGARS